ncbi:DUF58 domain-containing protein [Nocardioides sp. AE5]|uniref:DUF58 domain-containing protein n=1 Tax=Nocardioides sp. AE5 TaxID=2962573 RepID=UPI0028816253|nr:DUF58 domain-containing protein [Nocardioides sp. AE5]MDT0202776.1 DUF58 domain-containing protein [Nocardioides sp. AE5]
MGALTALTARGRWVLPSGLLLTAAGIGWRYPVLIGLGTVLVVLVVAELVAIHHAPALGVRRVVSPEVVTRNEPCCGSLHLAGRRRGGLVHTDAADQVDGRLVPVRLREHDGEAGTRVDYDIPTNRRGLVDVGPVQVRRTGLSGMATTLQPAGDVVQVRVLPRRIPIAGLAPGHRRAVNATGNSLEFGGTDLVGLHEYTVGDDLRRLHWPSSARTGTLMVREDADPSEPHVFVLLDDRASSHRDADWFEECVEVADALCRAAITAGSPLRLRTASGRHEIDVPGSHAGHPSPDARELEWLLAEVQLHDDPALADLGTRDLDVLLVVTGAAADLAEVTLAGAPALSTTLLVLDPTPTVTVESRASTTLLRGRSSADLASAWERTVAR